jgi:histidinol-phosphate/aromatic aminotransferase/cobyric acid decarboxylase-like protein
MNDVLQREQKFIEEFKSMKSGCMGHSPSIGSVSALLGRNDIVDACYLSNPYVSSLVARRFQRDLFSDLRLLESIIEHYPSQSRSLAPLLSDFAGVESDHIVVGNGVSELIPLLLRAGDGRTLLTVPTFSAYHQFAVGEVMEYPCLEIDPGKRAAGIIDAVVKTKPDNVVIINPNNPDGFCFSFEQLATLVDSLLHYCGTVIVDESFAGISFPEEIRTYAELVHRYQRVIVVRSLSKEFGIAGLRVGYAVMNPDLVEGLYNNGLLWNVNGFGVYFLKLLQDHAFMQNLYRARHFYTSVAYEMHRGLSGLINAHVIPSHTNFTLIELPGNLSGLDFSAKLLFDHGVYIRSCEDKHGLGENWIRVASRTQEENERILLAVTDEIANVAF